MVTSTSFDNTLSGLGITRTTTGTTRTVTKAEAETLDQSDFLKLMTAQLQHQDPFNPTDNTQMVAQMAQMSQLSGISEMSTTLKAIQEKLSGGTTSDALAYVGKTVLTEGKTAYPRSTGGIAGAVELGADSTDVRVTISDANGLALKSMTLGRQSKGTVEYDWDGKTDSGQDAGAGPFTVAVTAQNNGTSVSAGGLVWAPVQSVTTAGGTPTLTVLGVGKIAPSAVRQAG